ncbi:MAG: BON domain-containing protein [Deltaproteobacteria bacterium]|nr:BON domain-containing protein [Deltaproteobacteria bacterium]
MARERERAPAPGTADASLGSMPRTPRTYDEITRATVPDLDTSFRPSRDQIERSQDDFIRQQVADILLNHGADEVGYEVDRRRVMLRGVAPDLRTAMRIAHAVAALDDVITVDNHMTTARTSGAAP